CSGPSQAKRTLGKCLISFGSDANSATLPNRGIFRPIRGIKQPNSGICLSAGFAAVALVKLAGANGPGGSPGRLGAGHWRVVARTRRRFWYAGDARSPLCLQAKATPTMSAPRSPAGRLPPAVDAARAALEPLVDEAAPAVQRVVIRSGNVLD